MKACTQCPDNPSNSPYRDGFTSAYSDGFDGDWGKDAVVSCIGDQALWNMVLSLCRLNKEHFKGVWRPEVADWLHKWQTGVLDLWQRAGKAGVLYVVTYDNGEPGKNMKEHEIPFLDRNRISYREIKFKEWYRLKSAELNAGLQDGAPDRTQ